MKNYWRIKVTVIPCSKEQKIIFIDRAHIKVKLLSPPIKNKANRELIDLLSKYLGVNKSMIKIKHGIHTKEKLIEIEE